MQPALVVQRAAEAEKLQVVNGMLDSNRTAFKCTSQRASESRRNSRVPPWLFPREVSTQNALLSQQKLPPPKKPENSCSYFGSLFVDYNISKCNCGLLTSAIAFLCLFRHHYKARAILFKCQGWQCMQNEHLYFTFNHF